jgi:hypothetical protein
LRRAAKRSSRHFLKHIVHVMFVAHDPADHRPKQRVVTLVERVKATLFLPGDPGHQLFIP